MTLSEAEKVARKTVQSKLRAGIYTMPPMASLQARSQFEREVVREIEEQMTAHHGVLFDHDRTRDLPDELREEFWAYFNLAWQKFEPINREISKIERERWHACQAERNHDRPPRWWPQAGEFREVAIRADGSLWNPNNYPEIEVRAAIARAAERKQESIRRGV